MDHPTVFISYSHDSPEHADRVLAFANQLRRDGIDCALDQYEESPPEGWPKWMDRQIERSVFVLVICTETYHRRVMGTEEEGKGLGVRWESTLAYQDIHDAGGETTRFIPVLFQSGKVEHIPKPLRGATRYYVDTGQGYEDLYRRLTDQPRTIKPELGKLRKLPPRERKRGDARIPSAVPIVPKTTAEGFTKLPQTLLDFASALSLQDWEVEDDIDCLTLEHDATLDKRVLVKKGPGFDPAVSSPPLDWQPLHYHELVVQLHLESFIYINVSDEMGENRTLLYSSAILFGMNKWEQFMVPLHKDVSDRDWHSLIIDIPKHMEQAHWPGFVKVNWLCLRGAVTLGMIRGCDDEDSLMSLRKPSPCVVSLPVLRMSKVPQVLLDFASAPSLQDWENNDFLTLEYDTTLGKRALMKKGPGFDPAVSSLSLDWQPLHCHELTIQLHPESVICINVLDKTGKDRTLLYSSARPSELDQRKEFYVPLDEDVSDGNWHSLMINLPEHMELARLPGFVEVNRLSLRGEVALAGIRGCDDEVSLRESAIASPYSVVVPSSKDPAKFVPYVISNNRIDLVGADDLLKVSRSPQDTHELILRLSVEDPDKASAMIEQIGSELLVSLSDSPQDVRVLFSALQDQSPSVGKLLASMITPQFKTQMAKKSPEDWRETRLIVQRLRALEKVYDFFEHFVEPEKLKPHEHICIFANLISGGVSKSGIFQHPPEHGPSILRYSSIPVSDYMRLWLDFYFGILDERPNTGEKQTKFDKPCEGDVVEFGVCINDKRVKLPDSMLNVVGWVHHSLSIEPTNGELTVEFITHARGNAVYNWAAWGEPQLLGIRALY